MKILKHLLSALAIGGLVVGESAIASGPYPTGYAVQQFGLQSQGASVNVGSITDLNGGPNQDYAIIQDLWVHPGGSNCTTNTINQCEWIEHGKIYGTVGNYNNQSSDSPPPPAIANYKGHFYGYNRCTDKCRFTQVNYNGNIPGGRNTYHISYNNGTWYLLLDGNYVQDLPQFGALNYSKYNLIGIEKQAPYYGFTNGLQFTNYQYKGTDGVWRTVTGAMTNSDNGQYNMSSQYNGNTQTATFNN